MAQKIPTREGFDFYRQTMILGDTRYGINLRWNETCQQWHYGIDIDGVMQYGYHSLVEDRLVANAQACLPWSFGGLYLERINANYSGIDALPRGSLRLWFLTSFDVFRAYGSSRA